MFVQAHVVDVVRTHVVDVTRRVVRVAHTHVYTGVAAHTHVYTGGI